MKLLLPIVSFLNITNWFQSWEITKVSFGIDEKNVQVIGDTDVLKVTYPKMSYSPSKLPVGGVGFFASPKEIFMSKHLILSYQVRFDPLFDPVLGGKLPGLFLSRSRFETKGSSGGKYNSNTASIRLAWRKDFDGEVYVYLPKSQNKEYFQLPGFRSNGKYGDSLWKGFLKFDHVNWNNVTLEVKLNTIYNNIPQEDGMLSITINNNTFSFDKVVFREKQEIMLTSLLFDTFFGGGSEKYATPNETYTYFKNITLEKLG